MLSTYFSFTKYILLYTSYDHHSCTYQHPSQAWEYRHNFRRTTLALIVNKVRILPKFALAIPQNVLA